MKKRWLVGPVGIVAAVVGLGGGLLLFYHRPLPLITPSRGISGGSSKVILISFDGGSNELLHQFISSFPDNGFREAQKNGFLADQGFEVSSPSLTAPSHISIASGVAPSLHGIVSNQFHIPGDSIDRSVNGFTYELAPNIETIWEEAKKEGKQVGGIAYPALDGLSPKRTADWGISYTKQESPGFLIKKSKGDFIPYMEKLPDKMKSHSPPLYTTFFLTAALLSEGGYADDSFNDPHHYDLETKPMRRESRRTEAKHAFQMIAVDLTDDKKENYGALLIDDDFDPQNGFQGSVDLGKSPWMGVRFESGDIVKGSFCKLLSLAADLSEIKFYVGAVHSTKAYPRYYQDLLMKEIGFWPGAPDRSNLGKGVTSEMIVEQSLRLSDYLFKATLLAMKQTYMTWDLLLTYQPMLDELEHQFLLTDKSQKDFSKEKSEEYLNYIKRGYLKANEIVEALIKETRTFSSNIHLIVVSDHGMAPLKKIYYPNRLLRERGYIGRDDEGLGVSRKETIARAFSSGGISHVYVNLEGREKDGIVPNERNAASARSARPEGREKKPYEVIRDELAAIFKEEALQRDSPIQKVLKREEAEAIGLNHPNSGDVIIMGNPGFHFTDAITAGPILEDAGFYGQHGYDPALSVMKGIFAAYGRNFKKDFVKEPLSYKDIKPLVLKLLR
jgi:predicted AlkP superfamily phosphohydrolase/phosphomutase